MTIFFDHQTFSQQLYGGVSRYFCELISGINKTDNQAHLSLLHSNNAYLPEYGLNTMHYYFPNRHRLLNVTNQYYNIVDMRIRKFDVYHPTYFDPFFTKYIGRKPYVVTYHDMIHEKFGDQFDSLSADANTLKWKKDIAVKAAGFIAVSENTKHDMTECLGIAPERIRVINLSSSLNISNSDVTLSNKFDDKLYILYVGNRNVYKNFMLFLISIAPILKNYNLHLICAGGGRFSETENKAIKSCGVEKYVEQHSVTDKILIQLYYHATAFVFPSLYEGFGIPILEAMSCHCPCILSNRSSMPEIGGDAALYFDPTDVNSMRSVIITLLDNQLLRKSLIERGIKRASAFSWKRTVQQTLSLYGDIISLSR